MVAQDLAKFFDTIQLEQVILLAVRLGAPPQLGPLLKSFYENNKRLFTRRGVCPKTWLHATRSVLQGCPVSLALAALVMTMWSRFVCINDIDAVIYIDDRTFWHVGEAGPARVHELQHAYNRSLQFDDFFPFHCRPAKCKMACLLAADGSPGACIWLQFIARFASSLGGN